MAGPRLSPPALVAQDGGSLLEPMDPTSRSRSGEGRDPILGRSALALYWGAGRLAGPLVEAVLRFRAKSGKEDASRRAERLGFAGKPRPPGGLVWVHAASVGETFAVLPLVGRLAAAGAHVLLTTGTVTSARVAGHSLPPGVVHQYAPVDLPQVMARFLRHWRPDLAVFVESELWPSALDALFRGDIPLVLVNARLSERSFRSWHRVQPLAATLMRRVRTCLAQSSADAERLRRIGARDVVVCGNLKFDAPPPSADAEELGRLRGEIAGRCTLLAASTHAGEDEAVLQAHAAAARRGIRLVTILAPRHPRRGPQLEAQVRQLGLRPSLRSRGERIDPATEVYIADSVGEMGLWYRLADVAYLGGSLIPHGGQNPIEAARLDVPILHGPHVGNFSDIYAELGSGKAARSVGSPEDLEEAVLALLADPVERRRMTAAARECVDRFNGALDRTMQELQPYLTRMRNGNGTAQIA